MEIYVVFHDQCCALHTDEHICVHSGILCSIRSHDDYALSPKPARHTSESQSIAVNRYTHSSNRTATIAYQTIRSGGQCKTKC